MKVVVVGNAAIGKTRWISKLTEYSGPGIYKVHQEGKYTPTQRMSFSNFYHGSEYYKVWDTPGDLSSRVACAGWGGHVDLFVIVADPKDKSSMNNWIKTIRQRSDAPFLICDPKDLETNPTLPFD